MAIDIRATVTCSLGTLISASISDDYVQGTGLIKCKGSCELSGIVTPAVGTAVTFSYTKNGITRNIPRKLRVMSSFADPFRRTTTVELGCKLTYLSDLQEPIDWTPFDDILNNEFTVDDEKIVTIPIHASSVMDQCLTKLGITANSNPLTSKFSIARFDFGPGYVSVLSDLLVSECYCGFLNRDEELVVFSLDQDGGTGPVISTSEIIDLGSIGVGQLPGEAVVVSYSTLKLKAPDPGSTGTVNWEEQETVEILQPITHAFAGPPAGTRTFTGRQITRVTTEYETISTATAVSSGSWFYWKSLERYRDVVKQKVTTVTTPSAYIEGKRIIELANNGINYSSSDIIETKVVETTTYSRTTAEPVRTERLTYEDRRKAFSRLNIPLVFSPTEYVNPSGLILVSKEITENETSGEFTKSSTNTYQWIGLLQGGNNSFAENRETFETAAAVESYVEQSFENLIWTSSQVDSTRRGVTTYQGRPTAAERTNESAMKSTPARKPQRKSSSSFSDIAGTDTATAKREMRYTLVPDPINADADDDFGFNESFTYFSDSKTYSPTQDRDI